MAAMGAGDGNLSCRLLEMNMAEYVGKWDDGRRVVRACPLQAL
jgi:hypothetical protein